MVSCIDTQRSLALDWIMDKWLEVQRLLQFFTILIVEKNYDCDLISLMIANNSILKQITVLSELILDVPH